MAGVNLPARTRSQTRQTLNLRLYASTFTNFRRFEEIGKSLLCDPYLIRDLVLRVAGQPQPRHLALFVSLAILL